MIIHLPTGQTVSRHISSKSCGKGVGAVLLNGGIGGPGAGSSYYSVDDYLETTGVNAMSGKRTMPRGSGGKGLSKLNGALEKIVLKATKPTKVKNINFSL
jgi:hypothetical protein